MLNNIEFIKDKMNLKSKIQCKIISGHKNFNHKNCKNKAYNLS